MRAFSLPRHCTPLTTKEQPPRCRAVPSCSTRAFSLGQYGTRLATKEPPRRSGALSIRSMQAATALLLWALAAPGWADIAIVGARVYTVATPEPLEDATVLISNGRIEQLGAEVPVPFEYRRIDAAGKIVTPAFIESYSHFGLIEIEAESTTNDAALLEYPLGPAFDVSLALNPASTLIAVNRMGGVGRAISAPRPGVDALAGLAAAVSLGTGDFLLEPRTALFGHIGAATAELTGGSRAAVMQRLRRALDEASRFSPSRYRPGPGDYSRHDLAALKAFLRSGKPLVLGVDRAAEIRQAIGLAEARGLRLIVLGGAEAWRVRDALAAAGAAVIVRTHDNLPHSFETLGARLDNAALLHEAGVDVVFTAAETHNARNLRQLAGNAVAHGLPWSAALDGLTRRAAQIWGMDDVGTLTPGARADLAIWNGDPLELTTWAEHVIIDGKAVPMRSRQTQLFERYRDLSKPYGYSR